jgi:chitinase
MAIPTPYAGAYYPIYNSGVGQYLPPTQQMPFDLVSTLLVAFAHAYPVGSTKAAELRLEEGQPDEPTRLPLLIGIARRVNPGIKILISLGWGQNDWTYISDDIVSKTNNFPASVVAFVRQFGLDGFDIDDESIDGSSGTITQEDFDQVVRNLRAALDAASAEDGKPYFLSITPADGSGQVDTANRGCFDLINAQNYGATDPSYFTALGYPRNQIAWGVDVSNCAPAMPSSADLKGLAGIFQWNMTGDSACSNFEFTKAIAEAVHYPPSE